MATWIVHLRLAENLLGLIPGLDPHCFAIGNIAPDAGIPDENWESFTPPVEVSHFRIPHEEFRWWQEDLVFYRRHMDGSPGLRDDVEQFSFLLGYFFHLITDNLWMQQVAQPTFARFAAEFEADPKFGWEVKRDWYGLDFHYLRDHPESLFWRVFLDCSYTKDLIDFMPPEAVQQRIAYIQELYQRDDEKVQEHYISMPGLYLTRAEMDRFVEEATERLQRIYQQIWEEQVDTSANRSALELVLP